MQKDSIEALHQNWNPLVQEAGLSSLARVFRDPPKIIEEVTQADALKTPKVSTGFFGFSFYRAMYFSAKRGIAIACRLSVRPSVRLWRWWIVIT